MISRTCRSKTPFSPALITAVLIFSLISACPLTASDEVHDSHDSDSTAFIGKLLNFVILFGGLAFLLRKPLGRYLQTRSEEISRSLLEAEASQKEAEKELKKAKGRLKKMAREIEEIKQEGKDQGERLMKEIQQTSLREKERLKRLTKQEIDLLVQQGVQELRHHMAEMTTTMARERILQRISQKDQTALMDRSIEKLGALHETTGTD